MYMANELHSREKFANYKGEGPPTHSCSLLSLYRCLLSMVYDIYNFGKSLEWDITFGYDHTKTCLV